MTLQRLGAAPDPAVASGLETTRALLRLGAGHTLPDPRRLRPGVRPLRTHPRPLRINPNSLETGDPAAES
jgi:hypothetical protein